MAQDGIRLQVERVGRAAGARQAQPVPRAARGPFRLRAAPRDYLRAPLPARASDLVPLQAVLAAGRRRRARSGGSLPLAPGATARHDAPAAPRVADRAGAAAAARRRRGRVPPAAVGVRARRPRGRFARAGRRRLRGPLDAHVRAAAQAPQAAVRRRPDAARGGAAHVALGRQRLRRAAQARGQGVDLGAGGGGPGEHARGRRRMTSASEERYGDVVCVRGSVAVAAYHESITNARGGGGGG
mmetsp:Transcript_17477/g.44761  ORF Transcript_17477/g.44761 Transcript_17477/m.44761 type:complete len:242 (+) Transcript_17477:88-813(+)